MYTNKHDARERREHHPVHLLDLWSASLWATLQSKCAHQIRWFPWRGCAKTKRNGPTTGSAALHLVRCISLAPHLRCQVPHGAVTWRSWSTGLQSPNPQKKTRVHNMCIYYYIIICAQLCVCVCIMFLYQKITHKRYMDHKVPLVIAQTGSVVPTSFSDLPLHLSTSSCCSFISFLSWQ